MEQVKKSTYNGSFAIALEGNISSANASEVEAAIQELLVGESFDELVLDADNLLYISSAGLRVLLRLMKAGHTLRMVNVSVEVYDVLEMTGFSEMMSVEKAFRKVSIEGCEIIGQGSNGIVYRLDPDTIVKVYRNSDALAEMQREREISRKAFVLGIPTAIPYDVVRVGDQFGTVFELLNAKSITKLILADPENMDQYIGIFTDIMKQIHGTAVTPGDLPSMKEVALDWANFLKGHIPQEQQEKLYALIQAIPEHPYMLHGDYHSNNVMIQNGEPLMIDMDTLCVGHPVFELASTFNAYVGFSELDPEVVKRFLKLDAETARAVWKKLLPLYLNSEDEAYIQSVAKKAMVIGYMRLLRRTIRREADTEQGQKCIAHYKKRLAELLEQVDTLTF
ncbi:MAG: anti-sigma factor antagonist [Clostridia bacterium]|nr:anti-sigma factor antagonist [Clostridia bacterium]